MIYQVHALLHCLFKLSWQIMQKNENAGYLAALSLLGHNGKDGPNGEMMKLARHCQNVDGQGR